MHKTKTLIDVHSSTETFSETISIFLSRIGKEDEGFEEL